LANNDENLLVSYSVNKQEAAQFLEVSTRTLERLVADGRLTKKRERGKTRPRVVFDAEELSDLKTELSSESRRTRVSASSALETIGFRLDRHYVRRLTLIAEERSMSPGEFARHLVIQGIEGTAESRLADELKLLRRSLAETVQLFLIEKCHASPEDAADFIESSSLRSG